MIKTKTNKTKPNWNVHPTKAIDFLDRNNKGETWRDLCTEWFKDTNQENLLDEEGFAPADSKEVFRRVVDREAKKHPSYSETKRTLANNLADVYNTDAPLTQDAVYKLMNVSEEEFKLSGKFKIGGWGAMTVGEAKERFKNGSISMFFEPREYLFKKDEFERYLKKVKPVKVKADKATYREGLLLNTIFDPHFPFETYERTQAKILSEINKNTYDEIWFDIGQDWLHNDNRKGETTSGTPIDKVDMNLAIEMAIDFASPMIELALKKSNRVFLIHSKGNHDEMTGNMLVRILHAMFPQCDVDLEDKHYKAYLYGNSAIGLTHAENIRGTKRAKAQRLHDIFMVLYPDIFNMKHNRYIITGHEHNERVIDEAGTLVYTLSTRKPSDGWHVKKGFVGAHKRFTIFAFDDYEMTAEFKV